MHRAEVHGLLKNNRRNDSYRSSERSIAFNGYRIYYVINSLNRIEIG